MSRVWVPDEVEEYPGGHDGADLQDRFPDPSGNLPGVLSRLEEGEPLTEADRDALSDLVYTAWSVSCAAPVMLRRGDASQRAEELAGAVRLVSDRFRNLR